MYARIKVLFLYEFNMPIIYYADITADFSSSNGVHWEKNGRGRGCLKISETPHSSSFNADLMFTIWDKYNLNY